MKKIFLICPVRQAGDLVNEKICAYVAGLEQAGHEVHWPKRDTKQEGDPIGNRICRDNREAMFAADEVHVWYDPESKGSCFDLGMASVFEETGGVVHIANIDEVVGFAVTHPSIQLSVLIALAVYNVEPEVGKFLAEQSELAPVDSLLQRGRWVGPDVFHLNTPPDNTGALCVLGMTFAEMREQPRQIVFDFPLQPTEGKSFNNFLLWLKKETEDGPKTV